ncbi:hypothetical protein niasHT_034038 [Heterodera trifolii]|uniref:Major facilitator superfamily (MFS) profile domain-containing protein n=1 Tax=Heterodera trifolii TaxID=157864 RepID=A0ABD2IQS8_9BILA
MVDKICEYPSKKAWRNLLLISWSCAISGTFVGYATSSINGAILFIARDMQLELVGIGLLTSCFEVGAGTGSILSGIIADKFGRKPTLLIADLFYIITISATAMAPDFISLVLCRTMLGFASGAINVIAPVLLAEFCTANTRARALTGNQLLNTSGEALVFIVGALLGNLWFDNSSIWRWIYWLAVPPAILLLILHAYVVPESPRWLAKMGQMERSMEILRKIRRTNAEISTEMCEIKLVLNDEHKHSNSGSVNVLSRLGTPWVRRVLLLGIGVAIMHQGTGVSIGMKFGTFMLGEAGLSERIALLLNILIGIVSVVAMSAGLWLVSRASLRRMMVVAQIVIIFVHFCIAAVSIFLPPDLTRGWLTLGLLLVLMTVVQGICAPVDSLLMNEIFPLDMRGFGKGVANLAIYGTACALDQMFPIFLNQIGQPQTFAIFALIGFCSLFFTWRCLPETHGKSLEELEKQFKLGDWNALKKRRQIHKTYDAAIRTAQNGSINNIQIN